MHLDHYDLKAVHTALMEATGKDFSFDTCIMFLENNPELLRLIFSMRGVETEVREKCFEKAKQNISKYENVFGIEPKFSF